MLTRAADSITTTYAYDENGNQLTASASGMTITSTYDRLNRVLTVDDEDAGSGADTSYTYSLTSPTWTDPTGTYTATLDAFDRATVLNDPVNAANFTWTYRADGQPASMTGPNTNVTTYAYDPVGRELDRETKTGSTSRAHYTWTFNAAGQILSEAATVTGDPANGTVTYGYDKLGQLTGSTLAGTTTEYGWDAVTNRTSVKVGAGTPATTAYDAANRPTTGANPTAAYASDADGRLTARPGQTMIWDHLGRLTAVKDASGTTTMASYSYDPLDRLRIADDGAAGRTRFRYVGTTTSVAQWIDDATGIVIRNVGNGWTGERLLDWAGAGSDHRTYGTNAHHDVTWLADATGAVTSRLRYDPWGTPRSAVPAGYTPFRFQGSWHDDTTDLSWVVTRWYAPSLGRFLSEDSLLGEPRHPESRHLYAYAAGEPVARWDPDGRSPAGETRTRLADGVKYYSSGRKREAWRISAERETFYSVALGAPYAVTELGWRGDWAEYVSSTRPSYRYLFYSMPWWKARSDRGIQIKFVASFSIYTARGTHSTVPYVVARVDAESLGSVSAGGLCDCTYSLQTPWNEGPIRKIVIKATTQASQPHSDLQLGVSYVNKLVVKFDYPHNGT
jgi:RHS repeat-associated protein